jgi:hypothetical protein
VVHASVVDASRCGRGGSVDGSGEVDGRGGRDEKQVGLEFATYAILMM